METIYTWAVAEGGGTHITLRNRGYSSGFSRLMAPMMARAIRRANRAGAGVSVEAKPIVRFPANGLDCVMTGFGPGDAARHKHFGHRADQCGLLI